MEAYDLVQQYDESGVQNPYLTYDQLHQEPGIWRRRRKRRRKRRRRRRGGRRRGGGGGEEEEEEEKEEEEEEKEDYRRPQNIFYTLQYVKSPYSIVITR